MLFRSGVALIGALLLFAIPVDIERRVFALDWETASRLPWGVLLLFGGGLSLASAVSADPTGANGQPVPLPPGRSAPRSPLRSGPQPNPAADRSSSAMSVTSQLTPRSSRPR